MWYYNPSPNEMVFDLKMRKQELLREMENCSNDLESWKIKKEELQNVEKQLNELLKER